MMLLMVVVAPTSMTDCISWGGVDTVNGGGCGILVRLNDREVCFECGNVTMQIDPCDGIYKINVVMVRILVSR